MWTMNHHSSAVTIEKDGPSLDAEYEFRNDKTMPIQQILLGD